MGSKMMIVLILVLSASAAFADPVRVPEACEAMVYHAVDQALPADQFVSEISVDANHSENVINMTVTRDLGNENYCIKGGQVEVRYNNDDCTVIRVSVDPGNFDCG